MASDATGGSGESDLSTGSRGGLSPALLLFSGLFLTYALTFPTTYMHVDAHAATVEAWHLGTTGSPWLEDSLTERMVENPFIGEAANGHVVALRMAGPILLGLPFYWLGGLVGLEEFSQVPGGIASAAALALAATFLFLALNAVVTRRTALLGALAFALTTPSWTVAADQLWTHTVTQPAIAGAALAASRGRWTLTGLALGLGMLGRPHVALVAAAVGLGISLARKQWRPAIMIALPTVFALVVLALWNSWMFGSLSVEGAYVGRTESAVSGFQGSSEWSGSYPQIVNFLGFLVAPDRGLFVWTPFLLLMIPAIGRAWRTLPDWSKWLMLGGLLYSIAQLRLNYFVGGPTFWGYRHGLELLTCLTPAVVLSWSRAGRITRGLAPAVLGVQLSVMVIGSVVRGYYVPLEDVWVDNAAWVFARAHPGVFTFVVVAGVVGALAISRWPHDRLRHSESREVPSGTNPTLR